MNLLRFPTCHVEQGRVKQREGEAEKGNPALHARSFHTRTSLEHVLTPANLGNLESIAI